MSRRATSIAILGVADHAGWAAAVTADGEGVVRDRRRLALLEDGLPSLAYHHDAQRLPPEEAIALIARVQASAERCARAELEALAETVGASLVGVALRVCPPLPETVLERIASYHAQTRADGVMYRQALALAAAERGWSVHWYEAKRVVAEAARGMGRETIEDLLEEAGTALGPPWRKDHRVAMAAAIAAARKG